MPGFWSNVAYYVEEGVVSLGAAAAGAMASRNNPLPEGQIPAFGYDITTGINSDTSNIVKDVLFGAAAALAAEMALHSTVGTRDAQGSRTWLQLIQQLASAALLPAGAVAYAATNFDTVTPDSGNSIIDNGTPWVVSALVVGAGCLLASRPLRNARASQAETARADEADGMSLNGSRGAKVRAAGDSQGYALLSRDGAAQPDA